jgi:hypothetical protein
VEGEKKADAKETLAGSRIVQWWDAYDHYRMMHRYNIKLASGDHVQISMDSNEVIQRAFKRPDFFQHIVWQSMLNKRLRGNIVRDIASQGTNVVLRLVGGLYMTVPEDELFEDATLATLVLIGASHANARG